ncbi:gamma-glutamyl-gamma-aminobutyrate hydrolase family protein [Acidocella sp. KAb 2-4]|uniref:gamma-glutamyl-gamma-aminobutyrate hydrolase family protein n=1 Tax=Acidocella sp. KAb 2-4 TaxID=2885158 RepID=UPI001D0726AD|nr:gamma-glutamyl-gamma-aminobutyrate hydrolase family protein [Acidocella sp. KAb 2-4]MCB5943888.1 gamma-glutamyl-gamma-aminobutyrate hydrolase family protein [Acidocella sp. KAb 2-4]
MSRPNLIGIPACTKFVSGYVQHATPARYGAALVAASNAMPVLIPPEGEAMLPLLERLDGIMFNGSPSNVAPMRYGADFDATPDDHDPDRDATTLPMIRAALDMGMPILCICRGLQELNVALGGTLYQEVHKIPGRLDHRSPEGEHRFDLKHGVSLTGELAHLLGAAEIQVNSLHGQAIDQLAPGLAVEAMAPDGTIEAVRVEGAKAFAIAVQWHPEWEVTHFPDRLRLFNAFGEACREFAAKRK